MKDLSLLCPTIAAPGVVGLHRVAYVEWGRQDAARTVVCAHGLTRNGRDFDTLARHLSATCRVACPDLPGRGRSDWLDVPDVSDVSDVSTRLWGYTYPQYLVDAVALIARLDVPQVDWVGTSMGGLVGMLLAARPDSPIHRLVLNDIGPFVPGTFLDTLSTYVGKDPDFATPAEVESYLRTVHAGFGALGDDQWRHLARFSTRRKPDGVLGLAYDPAIGRGLVPPQPDVDLRAVWAAVRCPVLVVRGADSAALPADVAQEMTVTGPRATLVTVPGCGHAPSLTGREQIDVVDTWLRTGRGPGSGWSTRRLGTSPGGVPGPPAAL
ncbi:MAG TPA: alpha/beta hydrolase [Kineosporiaceae bacterium]